jgi:hypothetical protein
VRVAEGEKLHRRGRKTHFTNVILEKSLLQDHQAPGSATGPQAGLELSVVFPGQGKGTETSLLDAQDQRPPEILFHPQGSRLSWYCFSLL